jgi:hypothetical protein
MEFNAKFETSNCPINYDVKPTLLASGLRDLDNGIRYTACKKEPSGNVVLGSIDMRFSKEKSLMNFFQPSYKFYNKERSLDSKT